MTTATRPAASVERMPLVIAPDIIIDLIDARRAAGSDAEQLFDAIAADVDSGETRRQAFIAPHTVPMIQYHAWKSGGAPSSHAIVSDLLRLLVVAPLNNHDYHEALGFHQFDYDAALLFVTCRKVGAKYLITRDAFGATRTPVHRRSAAEALSLFK